MPHKDNILVGDVIYIVGHKKPDLDAIVAAQAYQVYRHGRGDFNYIAIRCDEVNAVTKWTYKRWGADLPPLVDDVSGKRIVLVDHTDPEQRAKGWENSEIIEVVDHHKLKLETSSPPKITIRPYGSTSTIITQKMLRRGLKIDPVTSGLLLSAILDDTLALRSPITTHTDKEMAGSLAVELGISNVSNYARELFSEKDVWDKMSAEQVITTDFKNYEMGDKYIRIAQIESMNNRRLETKLRAYSNKMQGIRKAEGIDIYIAMITDLIRNDCIMVISASDEDKNKLSLIFNSQLEDGKILHLPGIVSRKKQVVPPLVEAYS